MTTITIHNLPENLEKELRNRARKSKQSINQTVKDILQAGLSPNYSSLRKQQNKERFKKYYGSWTEEEGKAFDKAVEQFNRIDDEDWA